MLYLIGVEHKVQWRHPTAPVSPSRKADWDAYSSIIERSLCEIRPSVVAEEMNQEILDGHNKAASILLSLKKDHETRAGMKVEHIFAEPERSETPRGYKSDEQVEDALKRNLKDSPKPELIWAHIIAHQHPIREGFWFNKISGHLRSDILFVCGDVHLVTFSRLLTRKGFISKVVACRVGVHDLNTLEYQGLRCAQENGLLDQPDCFCLKGQGKL